MLVRLRSTSIALLGVITAIGLGLVAFISQLGWPGVINSPIPGPPVEAGAIHNATALAQPGANVVPAPVRESHSPVVHTRRTHGGPEPTDDSNLGHSQPLGAPPAAQSPLPAVAQPPTSSVPVSGPTSEPTASPPASSSPASAPPVATVVAAASPNVGSAGPSKESTAKPHGPSSANSTTGGGDKYKASAPPSIPTDYPPPPPVKTGAVPSPPAVAAPESSDYGAGGESGYAGKSDRSHH